MTENIIVREQKSNFPAAFRLLLSSFLGLGFFLMPIHFQGKTTVAFDVLCQTLTRNFPQQVSWYCFGVILLGSVCSLASFFPALRKRFAFVQGFDGPLVYQCIRIASVLLASAIMFSDVIDPKTEKVIWNTLVFSVGVLIPVGAIFLNIWVTYGIMEFVGTLLQPAMRRLFRLPGHSAIDNLTSWLGSYSVGLYLTRKMMHDGRYNRREAFTIATCFSTVSIGFVGIVVMTLDIAHLFVWVFISYFFAIYFLSAILCRMWPITTIPDSFIDVENPESPEEKLGFIGRLQLAWDLSIAKAATAPSLYQSISRGLLDGCGLTVNILGTILTIGFLSIMLVEHTSFFSYLGAPLAPVLKIMGIPDAETVAPAVLAGIGEMFVPALMVVDTSVKAKFFVATMSISQLIFFSSCAPMMLSMFREIPITLGQLLALFFIRTALLIPYIAAIAALMTWIGVL